MNEAYTGGCACGAVRYEVPSEPIVNTDCQCRDWPYLLNLAGQ